MFVVLPLAIPDEVIILPFLVNCNPEAAPASFLITVKVRD